MVSDLAAIALMGTGATLFEHTTHAIAYLGLATYDLGGPLNHLYNRHVERAVGSLALRGLGLAGAYAFILIGTTRGCGTDTTPPAGCDLIWLAPLPMLAAMVIDDVFLARYPLPTPRRDGVALAPGFSVGPGGGAVSLRGSF